MADADPKHMGMIRGALGLLYAKQPYRNRYFAPIGDEHMATAVAAGLFAPGEKAGPYTLHRVTEAGAALVNVTPKQLVDADA